MGKCPKCKKNVSPKDTKCKNCGVALNPKVNKPGGTLDVERDFDVEAEKPKNVDLVPVPVANVDSKNGKDEDPNAGLGTLATPEMPGVEPAPITSGDVSKTVSLGSPATPAAKSTDKGKASTDNTDDLATLDLPVDGAESDSGRDSADRTLVEGQDGGKESDAAGGSSEGGSKSGSSGRIRKMWERAAGSSANPMHSLKAEGQATDSVFERVATRTVAKKTADGDAPDYELIKQIGEGAMGVVYSARQKAIGRTVAIKAIKESHRKKDDSRRKFFYEAQITGELDHPNIVPIHELGATDDGMLFYSMKLIGGTEWQKVIDSKTRDENLDILMKIADAVAFAHAKRVIHRDIKPENIMLGTYGEVFLTDWGLAVNLSRDRIFTLGGTPAYMAPEMAIHKIDLIDTTSDIYLLGGMLFQIVTGRPPHGGNTVTEALRAAHHNEFAPVEKEDSLLDIAFRAMATQPDDRYATVEAMQEAIRQYRRNAESIALTKRSEESLVEAIKSKDYERFSRTIFGFQDAVELWPENRTAVDGIKQARMAYGECAFEKGDYDLCLQTLDKRVKDEAVLYERARKAKEAAEGREARFKSLRRVLAAVVIFALIGMSGLAAFAGWKWRDAIANEKRAVEQTKVAQLNFETAEEQRKVAVANKEEADKQTRIAQDNFETAEEQRKIAVANKEEADKQTKIAKENFETAENQRKIAVANKEEADKQTKIAQDNFEAAEEQRKIAVANRVEADRQRLVAERRAAEIEIGNYQSNLALAKARTDGFDVRSGISLLGDFIDPVTNGIKSDRVTSLQNQGFVPEFRNWGMRRTQLLANTDLPSSQIAGSITAMDFAADANIGIAGTADGRLIVLGLNLGQLTPQDGPELDKRPIDSLAISPDGNEVIFSKAASSAAEEENGSVFVWNRASGTGAVALASMQRKSIQGMVMTSSQVIGGINGGVYVWDRGPNWFNEQPRQIRDLRGRLQSLQIVNASRALAVSVLNNKLELFEFDPSKTVGQSSSDAGVQPTPAQSPEDAKKPARDAMSIQLLPESVAALATTAAFSGNGERLIVGTEDGKLYSGQLIPGGSDSLVQNANQTSYQLVEILPVMHRSAIRSIRTFADGTFLTTADEPVIHVWKQKPATVAAGRSADEWVHDTHLIGTSGNVAAAVFAGESGRVLGAGDDGELKYWDIGRQKQRNRIERIAASDDSIERQIAPATSIVVSNAGDLAKTVDSNGVIDSWELDSGKTVSNSDGKLPGNKRFEYIGHTPGSTFIDMAMNEAKGILVTSANLPDSKNPEWLYLESADDHNVEFCVWDTRTGKMLQRWTDRNEGFPFISIVDDGQQLLIANQKQTKLFALSSPENTSEASGELLTFNASIGFPHPLNSRWAMLVKSSGGMWMYDFENPDKKIQFDEFVFKQDVPMAGIWSPEGDRFYLLTKSGNIRGFSWNGEQLEYVESGSRPIWEQGSLQLERKWQIDMAFSGTGENQRLTLAVRVPTNPLGTDAFPDKPTRTLTMTGRPGRAGERGEWEDPVATPDYQYLTVSDGAPGLGNGFRSLLPIQNSNETFSTSFGEQYCVATEVGAVYCFGEGKTAPGFVFGRPSPVSVASDSRGTAIAMLGHDRSIWQLVAHSTGAFDWTPFGFADPGVTELSLSPGGDHMLATGVGVDEKPFAQVLEYPGGGTMVRLDEIAAAMWDKSVTGQLVVGHSDGRLQMVDTTGTLVRELPPATLLSGERIIDLHEFIENRSDGQTSNRWLLVHSASADSDGIQFVPLESGDPQLSLNSTPRKSMGANLKIATSPTESLFVTGATGGVTIWFAVPALNDTGRELFGLAGHGGAEITEIRFTADGNTLITADSLKRIFGWLSVDDKKNVAPQPLAKNRDLTSAKQ